ncbi:MAG: hypothetical protein ACP5OU_09320 [Methanothrix sp.]
MQQEVDLPPALLPFRPRPRSLASMPRAWVAGRAKAQPLSLGGHYSIIYHL